jgi:hypothetical protein
MMDLSHFGSTYTKSRSVVMVSVVRMEFHHSAAMACAPPGPPLCVSSHAPHTWGW